MTIERMILLSVAVALVAWWKISTRIEDLKKKIAAANASVGYLTDIFWTRFTSHLQAHVRQHHGVDLFFTLIRANGHPQVHVRLDLCLTLATFVLRYDTLTIQCFQGSGTNQPMWLRQNGQDITSCHGHLRLDRIEDALPMIEGVIKTLYEHRTASAGIGIV